MEGADLAFAGIACQAELIRGGEVSSRELVELYLARIEAIGPRVNAFTEVLAERALTEAEEADRGGEGSLRGVPIAIKDVEDVRGVVTQFGTGAFDRPAAADGELVKRLRAAGAVIIGKTTLPELAICAFTESQRWGITRNPWDTQRSPGGSSGGSGAAVAAGLVGAASASDGGGSIRIPAAFCGLFGLKPQRGRLPLTPADHWWGLSVHGCLTRTVLDTALFLDATADHGAAADGPRPERPYVEAARTRPPRLRIAISDRPARLIAPPIVTDEVQGALAETEALAARARSPGRAPGPEARPRRQQLRPALFARRPRRRRSRTPSGAARASHARLRPPRRTVPAGARAAHAPHRRRGRRADEPGVRSLRRADHADGR